jgi:enamine deaminase RidA (YjgF/YER057c/UK114 family)
VVSEYKIIKLWKKADMKILALLVLIIAPGLLASQTPEQKLEEMGITLPEMEAPIANYLKYRQVDNLIFLAGHGPCGGEFKSGKLGRDLTIEEGYEAARLTCICMLATLKTAIGDLDRVKQVVRVTGMVNSMPDFTDQPKVVNGFSDLLSEVFGERGKHARAAVGMASLPSNIPVEVTMIVELKE